MLPIVLKSVQSGPLRIDDWQVAPGEFWCVLGTNGSGKSRLAGLLSGALQPDAAQGFVAPSSCACLSFETQRALYERELYEDDSDFMNQLDYGHTGRELLVEAGGSPAQCETMARQFGIVSLLDRGIRQYSSGESRKLLLAKALIGQPEWLILDEPYEGLDAASVREFARLIASLSQTKIRLILLVNQMQDVHPQADHLLLLHQGKVLFQGTSAQAAQQPELASLFVFDNKLLPSLPRPPQRKQRFPLLINLQGSRVRYDETLLFDDLHWQVRPGEHWLISGPNGAGKSTLLQLITGDHPQCFQNQVEVFGLKRGSGESVWEIKQHLGMVSPALHLDYRVDGSALAVVVSGLYDSIGLYRPVTREEQRLAARWLAIVGLADFAGHPFRALSWGQQRLVLIARALIKQPPLLVLDEPTQGLDDLNRHLVLACIERIARLHISTLLFVSHRDDEILPLFQHHLRFEPNPAGPARYRAVIC